MAKCIKFRVEGLVQGIGFRYFVFRNATLLGLKGYVRNEYDGSVVGVALGSEENILQLKQLLKIGPERSRVQNATFEECEANIEFSVFEIR